MGRHGNRHGFAILERVLSADIHPPQFGTIVALYKTEALLLFRRLHDGGIYYRVVCSDSLISFGTVAVLLHQEEKIANLHNQPHNHEQEPPDAHDALAAKRVKK